MNQIQSICALRAGLISLSVALSRPVQKSGANRLPQNAEKRDGNIVKQTDKQRDHAVADQSDNETCAAKKSQLCNIGVGQRRHRYGSQEIDRIPDAVLNNQSIGACDNRHRDAAKNSADESSRIRMILCRDAHSMALFAGPQTRHGSRRGFDGQRNIRSGYRNRFRFLHWQHFSKPADSAAKRQDKSDNAHDDMRDQSRA